MTYSEFVTYLTTFLWKQNDADLIASMDSLVLLAETELSRKLDINAREVTAAIAVVGTEFDVPDDFKQLLALNSNNVAYSKVTSATLINERAVNVTNVERPFYTTVGKKIILAQDYDVSTPGEFTLSYRTKIPSFKTVDTSWLADDYLDLYTYCVLKHSAPFLREDERVVLWMNLFDDALNSVLEEDKFAIETGSPMHMNMARAASPMNRPRGLYSR